ncbi:hypothetical protein [Streptosporangium sp. NPDC051022]|uniref:hypothetical protein n=1 Tax=Streptosporangium sp. NPDC051022 TaxID=3155752 RepID=UPI00341FCFAA
MNLRPLLAAAPLVLVLAGCGSGAGAAGAAGTDGIASANDGTAKPTAPASASPSASTDPQDARLKFAQCMREHGVDMPDPGSDGRVRIQIPKNLDRAKADTAMRDCEHFMKAAIGDRPNPMNDPKTRDQMLKYAGCMREHGVDMPDPGSDGNLRIKIPKGGEQKLKEAEEACEEFRPGAGKPR